MKDDQATEVLKTAMAAMPQPAPQSGQTDIYPLVIADIEARVEAGRKKYRMVLQAHNGRDPKWDLYQELIDAVFYIRQDIVEAEQIVRIRQDIVEAEQIVRIRLLVMQNLDFFGDPPSGQLCLKMAADKLEEIIGEL